jgi:hypothetical protein
MIYNRQYQESLEEKFLAPYAIRSKLSKGRKYHETEPDYRTSFKETVTAFCTLLLSEGWNIKPRFSLITKVITTALG